MYSVGMINYTQKVEEHNLFKCTAIVDHQVKTNFYIWKGLKNAPFFNECQIVCNGFQDILDCLLSMQIKKKKYYNVTLNIFSKEELIKNML